MAYDIRKRNAKKKMAEGGAVPKIKLSKDHDSNAHLYDSDEGTSKMGGKVRSANLSKSWAKDERSSGPSIERSMAKDRMSEARDVAQSNLDATRSMPKPKLQRLAQGGMAHSTVIKAKMLDKYGNPIEEIPPEKTPGMSEDRGPSEEEYDSEDMYAEGGEIDSMEEPQPEEEDDHHASIAAAIMARRDRKKYAEGGVVENNNKEQDNQYNDDDEAALKENFDSDMEDVEQPEDTNEHGDDLDSDEHDMISKIRSKLRMKMAK